MMNVTPTSHLEAVICKWDKNAKNLLLLQVQKHFSTYKVFPLAIIIQKIRTALQQGIRQLFQSSILTQLLLLSGTVCIKLSIFFFVQSQTMPGDV